MSFQLTYSHVEESHADSLKRKEAQIVEACPATLSVEDENNKTVEIAVITEEEDGHHEIAPLAGMPVTVNGAPLQQKIRIMSGDAIQAGSLFIRFYAILPPARQSWQSKTLTGIAKLSLALLFALQLLFMFWIPWRLSESRLWDGAVAKQKITQTMDATRQRVAKMLKTDESLQAPPLVKLLVSEIALDLEERSSYLRLYEGKLSRSQRRRMVADLGKLNKLLDDIENGMDFPPIPTPDIDNAVKATIDKYSTK